MDGIHDLGGMQGFGPVTKVGKTTPFKDPWEIKVAGLMSKLVTARAFNMDEFRHAVERLNPATYVSVSYFERAFLGLLVLSHEKGLISLEEFQALSGRAEIPAVKIGDGRVGRSVLPELQVGDSVRVLNDFFAGHIRMPAYVRGKVGTIASVSPAYAFPDAHAHSLDSPAQRTFDVRFKSTDLWPDGCEDAFVHVGLFHNYLEKI
ncbi:nitrile hydratase subunit beta [Caballeronia sp. LZ001]|uniref:nitrile hydratase subunit beta n=1 Tax=Caballeronia sp. LZ001 TaxID=3038553 RepID=UPI00286389A0|nr:nitrile hydratase subunit beta [Caballeronia sp. LZ001]MDR5804775.1 nitrile hydratase subunit beta [Caballeronia sp. LZ001]